MEAAALLLLGALLQPELGSSSVWDPGPMHGCSRRGPYLDMQQALGQLLGLEGACGGDESYRSPNYRHWDPYSGIDREYLDFLPRTRAHPRARCSFKPPSFPTPRFEPPTIRPRIEHRAEPPRPVTPRFESPGPRVEHHPEPPARFESREPAPLFGIPGRELPPIERAPGARTPSSPASRLRAPELRPAPPANRWSRSRQFRRSELFGDQDFQTLGLRRDLAPLEQDASLSYVLRHVYRDLPGSGDGLRIAGVDSYGRAEPRAGDRLQVPMNGGWQDVRELTAVEAAELQRRAQLVRGG
ncbi:MAG: hypothetical protein HY319_12010 [Armatimonadetes bacterium]|nr:hypothetical protein [Armatimonadota bacterium]